MRRVRGGTYKKANSLSVAASLRDPAGPSEEERGPARPRQPLASSPHFGCCRLLLLPLAAAAACCSACCCCCCCRLLLLLPLAAAALSSPVPPPSSLPLLGLPLETRPHSFGMCKPSPVGCAAPRPVVHPESCQRTPVVRWSPPHVTARPPTGPAWRTAVMNQPRFAWPCRETWSFWVPRGGNRGAGACGCLAEGAGAMSGLWRCLPKDSSSLPSPGLAGTQQANASSAWLAWPAWWGVTNHLLWMSWRLGTSRGPLLLVWDGGIAWVEGNACIELLRTS
jgi:hypothetical protein